MRYDHAFSLGFTVYSDLPGDQISGEALREAIWRRLGETSDEELVEACGKPFDSVDHHRELA